MNMSSDVYKFADLLPVGVMVFSPDGGVVYANAAARNLLGANDEFAVPLDGFVTQTGDPLPPEAHPLAQAIRNKASVPETLLGFRSLRTLQTVWLNVAARPAGNDVNGTDWVIVTLRSASEERAMRLELERRDRMMCDMEMTDPLTGLPSRRFARYRLMREMESAKAENAPLSVGMVDLDRFKQVNEAHGRQCGDNVLCHVAEMLERHVKEKGFTARFGGEEFLVIFPKQSQQDAYALMEAFRQELSSVTLECMPLPVSISGSVTDVLPDDSRERVLERLDSLIYLAKLDGRNRIIKDVQ